MAEEQGLQGEEPRGGGGSHSFRRSFVRSKMGMLGLLMLVSTVLIAILAPWIAPYDPYELVQATAADVMAPPVRNTRWAQTKAAGTCSAW